MRALLALALCAPLVSAAPLPDAPGHCAFTIQYHPSNPQHVNLRIVAGEKQACDAKSLQIALKHLLANF